MEAGTGQVNGGLGWEVAGVFRIQCQIARDDQTDPPSDGYHGRILRGAEVIPTPSATACGPAFPARELDNAVPVLSLTWPATPMPAPEIAELYCNFRRLSPGQTPPETAIEPQPCLSARPH